MRVISPLSRGIEQIHLHPEARRHLELAITLTSLKSEKEFIQKLMDRPGKPN
jgi:hypothetical protein